MKKSIKLSFIIISAIAILCLSLAYIPFFQNFAVSTVERLKNDDINDIFWKQQMFAFASLGILFLLILNSILFTKTGKKLFEDFINSIRNIFLFYVAYTFLVIVQLFGLISGILQMMI